MLPAAPGLAGVCVCVGAVLHSYCIALLYPSTAIQDLSSSHIAVGTLRLSVCVVPRARVRAWMTTRRSHG